jgi:DnaJ like chaperone protein
MVSVYFGSGDGVGVWGKIIGSMTGFAFGGPLGALFGAFAGHAYDSIRPTDATRSDYGLPPPDGLGGLGRAAKQQVFSMAVIVLGAKMAKVDGVVSRAEVNAFKEAFKIPPEESRSVGRIFDTAKRDASGFEPYAQQIAWLFRHEPRVREQLLAGLFHIARADGRITKAKMDYLRRVGELMGLDKADFERVRSAFVPGERADPYAALGIGSGASNEEIKQAYRRLIRETHPDALIARGMPQKVVDGANERMAGINAAYDQIQRERGLR